MRNNEGRYEKSSYGSRKKQEAVYNDRFEISPFLLDEIPGGSCSCQLKRVPSPMEPGASQYSILKNDLRHIEEVCPIDAFDKINEYFPYCINFCIFVASLKYE
jgi:hypothetical protein